jgi:phosphoenolpyruvate carboxykinase (ATP)
MAINSTGTILTDMPVYEPERLFTGRAKILLFNDGETVGRFAGARIILGEKGVVEADYAAILREAVYGTRYKKMLHTEAYIGLDEDFMVKANLLVPETYENTLYNWLLNFQYINKFYDDMYGRSG